MNRISRRNFLKAAGVGAAALGLAACGGSSSSTASSVASSTAASSAAAAADVTIKVAAIETGYGADMWKKVAEAFTAQTGIKVDLTTDKKLEDVIGPSMNNAFVMDKITSILPNDNPAIGNLVKAVLGQMPAIVEGTTELRFGLNLKK